MTARIRAFEPEDLEAVAEIFNQPSVIHGTLQLPYRSVEERRQREASRSTGIHRLVAELDGRVVGTAALHTTDSPRRRHAGSIGMGVHDEFQGRGVGTALMAAIIDLADNWLNLHRIELEVFTDNAAAVRLYEKFGFLIEGTLRDYGFRAGEYVDAYAMARLRPDARTGRLDAG